MNHLQLSDIDFHVYKLSRLFATNALIYAPGNNDWLNISEWLNLAAGIVDVDFDSSRFDMDIVYCSGAAQYESVKSDELSFYVAELVKFSFIWGSLEAVWEIIQPKDNSRLKIDKRIGKYLTELFEPNFEPLLFYQETLIHLKDFLKHYPSEKNLQSLFGITPPFGKFGIGLRVVYKMRNFLAHGSLSIPASTGIPQELSPSTFLIQTCSRILLLSIQMMMLSHFRDNPIKVDDLVFFYEDQLEDINILTILSHLHTECH